MYTHIEDTIVAIATATGRSPRGIVRVSGDATIELVDGLFESAGGVRLADAAPFRVYPGVLNVASSLRAPVSVYLFRAPRSYTRQNMVELHTIGSPPLLALIVDKLIGGGARHAEPGEFTARAFLNGAISLSEAESVASIIAARSDAQLRAARRTNKGALIERVRQWTDQLEQLLSLVVADIDFAEEPIDFIQPTALRQHLAQLIDQLDQLIQIADSQQRADVLPHVLLLGPPNAGKSTLMNRLCGANRAIASATAGTTRDLLAAPMRFGQIEAVLLDSAGVDRDPDELMALARKRAVEAAGQVNLVCVVLDASMDAVGEQLRALHALCDGPWLIAGNKIDLITSDRASAWRRSAKASGASRVCMVSAAVGIGINDLHATIAGQLTDSASDGTDLQIVINSRQREALATARHVLARCRSDIVDLTETIDAAELIAAELREALDAFTAITGEVTTDALLGRIFSNFCIGK